MIGGGKKEIHRRKKTKLVEERKKLLQLNGRTRIKGNKKKSLDLGVTRMTEVTGSVVKKVI